MKGVAAQGATLGIGIAAGVLAWLAHVPLPWMLGPMIGTTALSVMGAPLASPNRLRPLMMPVIGVLLGSRVTAEVLASVADWWGVVALLVPFLLVTAGVSYQFYRRVARFDPVTAYYSAMPGGLSDMIIMGGARGGDERHIALAHATRILIVIGTIVLFFGTFLGVAAQRGGANWVGLGAIGAVDGAVLLACAVIGVPMGRLLRLPAGVILGPMLLSGAVHVLNVVEVPPPSLLVIAAQIVIGTTVGCRFAGTAAREVGRDMALGAASSVLMMACALGFAALAALTVDIDLSQLFLAYSPGGITEMSLLALAMGQDVAFVTVLHVLRLSMVLFGAGPVYRITIGRGT